jgi:hypothetical protein
MNKFLSAARRDAWGILQLYFHLFFRRKWYKSTSADLGHSILFRIWPMVMGVALPFILGSVLVQAATKTGVMAAIGDALAMVLIGWVSYRIYKIFHPEKVRGGTHIRGAEIDDLSGEGEEK